MRFGPMKPVGIDDPRTGRRPYAVVQLRKENREGTLFNLVGFQTNLKFGEQKRVFSMIPGLENAEFMRYGVMHRNTFINSPELLNSDFSMRSHPDIYFVKRWHILVKTTKEKVDADDLKYKNISPRNYYLPVPEDQIVLNPNLKQNWGYAGETSGDPYTAKGWE